MVMLTLSPDSYRNVGMSCSSFDCNIDNPATTKIFRNVFVSYINSGRNGTRAPFSARFTAQYAFASDFDTAIGDSPTSGTYGPRRAQTGITMTDFKLLNTTFDPLAEVLGWTTAACPIGTKANPNTLNTDSQCNYTSINTLMFTHRSTCVRSGLLDASSA
jgi:hypothetical protein